MIRTLLEMPGRLVVGCGVVLGLATALVVAGPLLGSPYPAVAPNAWTPAEGYWLDAPEGWRARHAALVEATRAGGADVVFLGDSVTHLWDQIGRQVWNARLGSLNCRNCGACGDTTTQILWRLNHDLLSGPAPKVVVLMVGANNYALRHDSPADVAKGLQACVDKLCAAAPTTTILLYDVFPIGFSPDNPGRAFNQKLQAELSAMTWPAQVRRVNINERFLAADGTLSPDVASDGIHLTEKGYQIWAEALVPTLHEQLQARP